MPDPHRHSGSFLESLAANAVWWLLTAGVTSSAVSWLARMPDVLRGALFAFGAVLLLLSAGVVVFRFTRRTGVEAPAGTLDPTQSVSFHTFSLSPPPGITKERKRELLTELLSEAKALPEDMPDDARNVWHAFRSGGLLVIERLYGQASQHYNDFAHVVLISPAIRMDVRADWRRGRIRYIDCIKLMLKDLDLFE